MTMNRTDRCEIARLYSKAEDMSHDMYRGLQIATERERGHRRMGRGFAPDGGGYGAPVDVSAMYFMLKAFVAPFGTHSVEHRLDYVCGYSAALQAKRQNPKAYRAIVRAARPLLARLEYPFNRRNGGAK